MFWGKARTPKKRASSASITMLPHNLLTKHPKTTALSLALLIGAAGLAVSVHNKPATQAAVSNTAVNSFSDSLPEQPTPPADQKSDASSTTTTSNSTNVSANSEGSTSVSVNGETVPVPQNGSVHKTVTNENGTTTVDVQNSNNSGNTSTQVNTFSSSSTTTSNGTVNHTEFNSM